MIEFMPWYEAGRAMVRCGGDGGCGAVLVDGDTDLHRKFHKRIDDAEAAVVRTVNRLNFPEHHTRVLGV